MNTQFSRRPAAGRGYSQARSFGGPSRGGFGGGRGRSSGFGGGRRKRFQGDYIDERLYINKATKSTEVPYVPVHTFADFGVHPILADNLARKGFVNPSPIQDQAIPVALTRRDVIGIANTGTGKTAAFLIPIIHRLVAENGSGAIILAPTRELAQQIQQEFIVFTRGMNLYSGLCVGGMPIMNQIRELQKGVHVVIGTPGRVQDLIDRRKINPATFDTVVLDEADRMLDMGFIDDMRSILGMMPHDKQGMFFSATFVDKIRMLCGEFLVDPIQIKIPSRDTSSSVEQDVVRVGDKSKKVQVLHELLQQPEFTRVLIFREMKHTCDELQEELARLGHRVLALHGDKRNRERMHAIASLKNGAANIVIATDVAARGIDIPDVSHVINFDVPQNYETYVHRIGRTGRADKSGVALTFI
jgi:ATP-dependent RNA helicase RhlE